MTEKDIKFFGAIDREGGKENGKVKHSYPAWYYTNKLDELDEDIAELERKLAQSDEFVGQARASIPEMKRELTAKKQRKLDITNSMPRLSDKDKDEIARLTKEIEASIKDIMPKFTDEMRGTASAHDEAAKMVGRCVSVPHGAVKLMQNMGINAERGGKISRNDAVKFWKITKKLLGESSHTGHLRRDIAGGAYKIHKTLAELERG